LKNFYILIDKERPMKRNATTGETPVILTRDQHGISRKLIDENALKVLYRLNRHGHLAYLVGGSVRDLLLERTPKDFDVGTDTTPEQVKTLFRNCFLIGRRFRLAHLRFRGHRLIEVSTFRRNPDEEELPTDDDAHFHFVQNVFGSPREDAFRRDFTINALFYDISNFAIIDHVGGLRDLDERRLRMIGDPLVRFSEDPVRMLRALEFSARLDFAIDQNIIAAIDQRCQLLAGASRARLREEILELFRHGVAGAVCRLAQRYGLLDQLFPEIDFVPQTFALLDLIDRETLGGEPLRESQVLAALTLPLFVAACGDSRHFHINDALLLADKLLHGHCQTYSIAQGVRSEARELLVGCLRLLRGLGHKGEQRFLHHPLTPRIFDFFALWGEIDHSLSDCIAAWQTKISHSDHPPESVARKPRRRRRPRRHPQAEN